MRERKPGQRKSLFHSRNERAYKLTITLRVGGKTFFNPRASLFKGNLVRVFKKKSSFFSSLFFFPFFLLFSLFSSFFLVFFACMFLLFGCLFDPESIENALKNPLENTLKNPLKNTLKNPLKNALKNALKFSRFKAKSTARRRKIVRAPKIAMR